MAVQIKPGSNGEFKGRIGNTSYYVDQHGRMIARSATSTPRGEGSADQIKQNAGFNVIQNLLRPMKNFIKIGFHEKMKADKSNSFAAAKSYNMVHALKKGDEGFEIDWENLRLADGKIDTPKDITVKVEGGKLHFSWDSKAELLIGSANDRTMILLYEQQSDRVFENLSGAQRKEGADVFPLDFTKLRQRTFDIYIAFKDIFTNEVSNSVYCGRHTPVGI